MERLESRPRLHERAKYRLQVCGLVEEQWADYYAGMTIKIINDTEQEPMTALVGWLEDQASLLGMLTRLHEWGHALISVEYLPEKR